MPLVSWNDKFSVEVPSIDQQHQKLFAMMNELYDAMSQGKGKQLAPEILDRLVDYTREHFAAEEAMMKRANYPDFAAHQAEHEKLKAEVAKMLKDSSSAALSMPLLSFMRDWLQSHIVSRDKCYTASMRTAGIR
jgi:hemerythrin